MMEMFHEHLKRICIMHKLFGRVFYQYLLGSFGYDVVQVFSKIFLKLNFSLNLLLNLSQSFTLPFDTTGNKTLDGNLPFFICVCFLKLNKWVLDMASAIPINQTKLEKQSWERASQESPGYKNSEEAI